MVPKEVPKFHPPSCRKRDLYQDPKVFKELDDYVFAVRIVTCICRVASIWKVNARSSRVKHICRTYVRTYTLRIYACMIVIPCMCMYLCTCVRTYVHYVYTNT